MYIYIYVCVCVCVCVYRRALSRFNTGNKHLSLIYHFYRLLFSEHGFRQEIHGIKRSADN